jgi:hypothetical protein
VSLRADISIPVLAADLVGERLARLQTIKLCNAGRGHEGGDDTSSSNNWGKHSEEQTSHGLRLPDHLERIPLYLRFVKVTCDSWHHGAKDFVVLLPLMGLSRLRASFVLRKQTPRIASFAIAAR